MPVVSSALTTAGIVAGAGLLVYRRIRKSFGRQAWNATGSGIRLGVLSLVWLSLVAAAVFVPGAAWAVAGGMVTGAALGVFTQPLTRVECVDGLKFTTPNPWIGAALISLLLGRLLWRLANGDFAAGGVGEGSSPWTLAIAATIVTYYVADGIGLLARMRRLPATPGTLA